MGQLFFRPDLVPATAHPIIERRDPEVMNELLVRHLYTYLDFTEHLEHSVVNQVAFSLGRSKYGLKIPRNMELDAYKLYVDEAYHAMFSADLAAQVEEATGIRNTYTDSPAFLDKLGRIRDSVSPDLRWLVDVLFTVVSETLISGTLTRIPSDKRVVQGVREVIKDHADDEAIHHAYFAQLLNFVWPSLSDKEIREVGKFVPDFILGFLEPDYASLRHNLREVGLNAAEVEDVVKDSYPKELVVASAADVAKVTLRHFRNVGAFQRDEVYENLVRKGFGDYL